MVGASLPRRVFGSNVNPLPFLLTSATDELISEVGEHLIIRSDLSLEEVSVKRVDIVRDFHNVDQIGPLLQGLSTVPRSRSLKRHLHGDVAWETLTVGVGAWSVSLYDKEAETKGVARPGHLRCEIRLRPKRLTSVWARLHGGCVNVVPDVSTEKMECLARASFEEVGFHRTVVPPDEAVRRALQISDFRSGAQRLTLVGTIVADSLGLNFEADRKTMSQYRDAAQRHDLAIGAEIDAVTRLDWATGTALCLQEGGRESPRYIC